MWGDFLKIHWKNLITCTILPLAVGNLASLLTQNSQNMFSVLNKPPLSPPGWLFPIVWTILYLLMGIASYLIFTDGASGTRLATTVVKRRRLRHLPYPPQCASPQSIFLTLHKIDFLPSNDTHRIFILLLLAPYFSYDFHSLFLYHTSDYIHSDKNNIPSYQPDKP